MCSSVRCFICDICSDHSLPCIDNPGDGTFNDFTLVQQCFNIKSISSMTFSLLSHFALHNDSKSNTSIVGTIDISSSQVCYNSELCVLVLYILNIIYCADNN